MKMNDYSQPMETIMEESSTNIDGFGDSKVRRSNNLIDNFVQRELGNHRRPRIMISDISQKAIQKNILEEFNFHPTTELNKVFCSQWLNDEIILFGTKCNNLVVFNIRRETFDIIPTLTTRPRRPYETGLSGLYAVESNPSSTFLVTSGECPNAAAVYYLPTLSPFALGDNAHKDLIFDIKWVDDTIFISGSRDNTLALWNIDGIEDANIQSGSSTYCNTIYPKEIKCCINADRIRKLLFIRSTMKLYALSLNGIIHAWDTTVFKQLYSRSLPQKEEAVCMAFHEPSQSFSVGSRSYITLLDPRCLDPVRTMPSLIPDGAIRSLSYTDNILTIGTGEGTLLFYDIRRSQYIINEQGLYATLRSSKAFDINEDDNIFELFTRWNPALYTHCYDKSKTRIFVGGGPLAVNVSGNYVSVWR